MTENKEQYDDNIDLKVSERLKSDLDSLFKTDFEIPHQVDMAILNKASQKLTHPRSVIRILRWIGPVAAAAAIIIFVSLSNAPKQSANVASIQEENMPIQKRNNIRMDVLASISRDFDNNGKVNILDAFKLAKLIKSEESVDKKWDINGDGLVNNSDVDEIAIVAVSLE